MAITEQLTERTSTGARMSLRVLHVTEALTGGVSTALRGYLHNTPEIEHLLLADTRDDRPIPQELVDLATQVRVLPSGHLARIRALRECVLDWKPDIVHAHSSRAGVYARLLKGHQTKVVYTPHGFGFVRVDVPRWMQKCFYVVEKLLTPRSDAIVAVSPREATLAKELSDSAKVFLVPHVAPVRVDSNVETRATKVVVTLGRLTPAKDPDFFIDVVKCLRKTNHDLHFEWIGGGEMRYTRALRNADVTVTGWLEPDVAHKHLEDADIYIHTALWEAGAPFAVLEAASLNKPIFARDIPAFQDTGLSLVGSSPKEIASLIDDYINGTNKISTSIQTEAILDAHSHEQQTKQLRAAYHFVAGERIPSEQPAVS